MQSQFQKTPEEEQSALGIADTLHESVARSTSAPVHSFEQLLSSFKRLSAWRKRFHSLLCLSGFLLFLSFVVGMSIANKLQTRESNLLKQELAAQREWARSISTDSNPSLAALETAEKAGAAAKAREEALRKQREGSAAVREPIETFAAIIGLMAFAGCFAAGASGAGVEARQRQIIRQLAKIDDVTVLGPLIQGVAAATPQKSGIWTKLLGLFDFGGALSTSPVVFNRKQRSEIIRIATDLLPRLQKKSEEFGPEERESLASALGNANVDNNADFIVQGIQVFERMEDARILNLVEGLASIPDPLTPARQRIKTAAQSSLPILRQIAQRERQSSSLMRPAAAPVDSEGRLLKPAANTTDREPELLLHPYQREL